MSDNNSQVSETERGRSRSRSRAPPAPKRGALPKAKAKAATPARGAFNEASDFAAPVVTNLHDPLGRAISGMDREQVSFGKLLGDSIHVVNNDIQTWIMKLETLSPIELDSDDDYYTVSQCRRYARWLLDGDPKNLKLQSVIMDYCKSSTGRPVPQPSEQLAIIRQRLGKTNIMTAKDIYHELNNMRFITHQKLLQFLDAILLRAGQINLLIDENFLVVLLLGILPETTKERIFAPIDFNSEEALLHPLNSLSYAAVYEAIIAGRQTETFSDKGQQPGTHSAAAASNNTPNVPTAKTMAAQKPKDESEKSGKCEKVKCPSCNGEYTRSKPFMKLCRSCYKNKKATGNNSASQATVVDMFSRHDALLVGDLEQVRTSVRWIPDTGCSKHLVPAHLESLAISVREENHGFQTADGFIETNSVATLRVFNHKGKATTIEACLNPQGGSALIHPENFRQNGDSASFDLNGVPFKASRTNLKWTASVFTDEPNKAFGATASYASTGEIAKLIGLKATAHLSEVVARFHRRAGHYSPKKACALIRVLTGKAPDKAFRVAYERANSSCIACARVRAKVRESAAFVERDTTPTARRALKFGDILQHDVIGPFVTSTDKQRYISAIVDVSTGYVFAEVLATKTETVDHLRRVIALDVRPIRIQTDMGVEFTQGAYKKLLQDHEIVHTTGPKSSHTAQGAVEARNLHLQQQVQLLLIELALPASAWTWVVPAAASQLNWRPYGSTLVPPAISRDHDAKFDTVLTGDEMHYKPHKEHGKTAERGRLVRFIASVHGNQAFVIGENDTQTFLESVPQTRLSALPQPPLVQPVVTSPFPQPFAAPEAVPVLPTSDLSPVLVCATDAATGYCQRLPATGNVELRALVPTAAGYMKGASTFVTSLGDINSTEIAFDRGDTVELLRDVQPVHTAAAAESYAEADRIEAECLKEMRVLVREDPPAGVEPIRVHILRSRKKDGRLKTRAVAAGDRDPATGLHTHVSLPTPFFRRLLFVHALLRRLPLHVGDVRTAFLHAPINRSVYVRFPKLHDIQGVYRLERALYGLRDAPRLFNDWLVGVLDDLGWTRVTDGFWLRSGAALLVYVDDLMVATRDRSLLVSLSKAMRVEFTCQSSNRFLGVEVRSDDEGILVDAREAVEGVTGDNNLALIGELGWAAQHVPELAVYASKCARDHSLIPLALRALSKVSCTSRYTGLQPVLTLYSDASHSTSDFSAQLGWIAFASPVGSDLNPLAWRSFSAKRLVRSVAMAELLAALDCVQSNYGHLFSYRSLYPTSTITLCVDNSAVVQQLTGDGHVDPLVGPLVDLLKQLLDDHGIKVLYVPTTAQKADNLTKFKV